MNPSSLVLFTAFIVSDEDVPIALLHKGVPRKVVFIIHASVLLLTPDSVKPDI
jgi:hypothetical protein